MLARGLHFGKYEVLEPLGVGGMGEVYRARDARLGRDVALKVLPERVKLDADRLARFEREARVLASLNHPNIAMLHGIEELDDTYALVLELVDGQTLAKRIAAGPVPLPEALAILEQIAAALEAAHEHGVVHRDLKPSNVKLRADGHVKLLDFGVAKVLVPTFGDGGAADLTVTSLEPDVGDGFLIGTPAYMSPEQTRGGPIDKRTDVWAFGCLSYELLTGRPAFHGDTTPEVLAGVIEREPDLEALPAVTPPALHRLLERCLVKDPRRRLRDIGDARLEIEELRQGFSIRSAITRAVAEGNSPAPSPRAEGASRSWLGYALTVLLTSALAVGLYGLFGRDVDQRWLSEEAMPRIEAYLDVADWESAYALAKEAEARVPDNRELAELWTRISWRVTIPSDPPGAAVFRQAYDALDGEWEALGGTPLENVRIPYGLSRLRFELDGYRPLLRALGGAHLNWEELEGGDRALAMLDQLLVGPDTFKLDTEQALTADKVRAPGWRLRLDGDTLALRDFFLGRYEVTNAEFKAFVDAGGYLRPDLWDPVVVDGESVPFDEAVKLFTDRTRRPGPSTWEAGDYPEGKGGFPVSGVSWYEAAAYARFVGAELPTAHHWQQALANSMFPWLLPASNFGGDGPRAVAESRAMSHLGAFDMAGNVREWTATAVGDERIILGGSWNDAYYIAGTADTSAPPLDRSPGNGIRLAITEDEPAIAARVREPISRSTVSPAVGEPVSDEVYAAYGRIFDYDRGPLNPSIEATETTRMWARERIRLDAAYGTEQLLVHLYLPTTGAPPYQSVVYWPGWDTFGLDDVDQYFAKQIDFIVKSGRAVAFPIYKGTFERRVGSSRTRPEFDTVAYRDNTIDTVKDLRRTIDYLETRADIDHDAIGFFGYSWGGVNGPTALAQEPRLKLGVINIGLLPPMASTPEVDPVNALVRVRVPVLMLSGEFDAMIPVENARRYFDLIGVPPSDKRHVIEVGGHYIPRDLLIRETLDWLDQHLGPARR